MSSIRTETETVIKKILPYLQRRGYDMSTDFDFETAVSNTDRYSKGYVDILVTMGKVKPVFLVEAKRISKNLTTKDRDQAIQYAKTKEVNVPFVVVTNGIDIQCFNTKNKKRILWDGKVVDKVPKREQIALVLRSLKSKPEETSIAISNDETLPFRPGLPLRQLNALFYKNHSIIRKIEKNEESAFADFSKLLFLKLLEEKCDIEEDFELPYSYRFHELADKPTAEEDQVMDSILSMIDTIVKKTPYGEVLEEKIRLKNPKTFHKIIKSLSSVSFYDCSLDSKGAAFEYFVRATLKGKKLGQYFTPRQLVQTMTALIGRKKIVNSILSGTDLKILDPACGTGGFLVHVMQDCIEQLNDKLNRREITKLTFTNAIKKLKETTFFGSDANEGVAASAKMNMIIAGDGHTNIQHEDSLAITATNWKTKYPDVNIILTNPPFGTSEGDSLTPKDLKQYKVSSSKGQYLFIQKMISTTIAGGDICTVIDEGVLNTESGSQLRKYILQHCKLVAVINLPNETFKPNKINVKCSLLYLEKRETPDLDLEEDYNISVCKLDSLGYHGSGDSIRNFDMPKFLDEIEANLLDSSKGTARSGYMWRAYDVKASELYKDSTFRFDFKYWNVSVRKQIKSLTDLKSPLIKELNSITTRRGKSPTADSYVDEEDGYALVVKAGSSVSKFGTIIRANSDWIEKSIYDEFVEKEKESKTNINTLKKGDIILSSTGDGTLGKCCVYDLNIPAIGDSHVTIIRVDKKKIDPYYLADYLRKGFGSIQIARLYTGSTGLIELTPDQVDTIVVDLIKNLKEQKLVSKKVRQLEKKYLKKIEEANSHLQESNHVMK